MFGQTFNVASVNMAATTNSSNAQPVVADSVYLGPFALANDSHPGSVNGTVVLFDKTQRVGGAGQTFMVGPVPISVSIDFDVRGRLAVAGTLNQFGGDLYLTPTGGIYTTVSVGVGVNGVLAAGVRGELDLLTVSLPVEGKANWTYARAGTSGTDTLTTFTSANLDLSTLDGGLSLYADVGPLEYVYAIPGTSWTGIQIDQNLYTAPSGTRALTAVAAAPPGAPATTTVTPPGVSVTTPTTSTVGHVSAPLPAI